MTTATRQKESAETQELRSSVRFPLRLPIEVGTTEDGPLKAETQNISSGGVLFDVDQALAIGSKVEFRIAMPAHILGTPTDIVVRCVGRVVRCSHAETRMQVAAVIDEYRFVRA